MEGVYVCNRACVVCGKPFAERGRIDRMYCIDGGCRTLAWKKRKRARADASPSSTEVASAPPASATDSTPYGILVQLTQRLESELTAARRTLAAAEKCIVQLRTQRPEVHAAVVQRPEQGKAPARGQEQTAHAATERLVEMEGEIRTLRKELAELKLLHQAAQGQHAECQAERTGASSGKSPAEQPAKAAEKPSAPASVPMQEQAPQSERQHQPHVQNRQAPTQEATTDVVQSANAAQRQARAAGEALLIQGVDAEARPSLFQPNLARLGAFLPCAPEPSARTVAAKAADAVEAPVLAPAPAAIKPAQPNAPAPRPAPEKEPTEPPVAAPPAPSRLPAAPASSGCTTSGLATVAPASTTAALSAPSVPGPQSAAPALPAAAGIRARTYPGLAAVAPASIATSSLLAPSAPMPQPAPEGALMPHKPESGGELQVQRTHRLPK